MDHVLTEHGLRLTYLRDTAEIDALDQERILDDLFEGTPPGETPLWTTGCLLSDYDHLVLASDTATGRVLGLLGGQNRVTARQESVLLLETGFVIAPARGQNLLRRMIALALLRIAGLGSLPDAIAVLTRNPVCCHVLRAMGEALHGATFAPDPEEAVIRLDAAALMHRIGNGMGHRMYYGATLETMRGAAPTSTNPLRRLTYDMRMEQVFTPPCLTAEPMLVALDLRGADEKRLLDDARRMYRAKPARPPIYALPAVERNPFWPSARPAEQAARP